MNKSKKKYITKFKYSWILLTGLIVLSQCNQVTDTLIDKAEITPIEKYWGEVVPQQEIPEGLTSLSAESCGVCHQDHYEEWLHSTHSHAWTDLQFQAELKKESSPLMCINCHIPLQNQQEYIVKGLENGNIYKPVKVKNPHFDKKLQQEGINCASCHVRGNVIIGPTGKGNAPHKIIKDTIHLSERLCISCHNGNAEVTDDLVCTFETADEWKAGPYYGDKNCKSCHMDTITRAIVPGLNKRISHRHYFKGSGIPKRKGAKTIIFNGLTFKASKLRQTYSLNSSIDYYLTLKNEFAGHKVPTGNPDRFISVNFIITNKNNDTVFTQKNRIGEEWEWYPVAKKISDNNLKPKEERTYSVNYLPKTPGEFKLKIIVEKHRISEETANYSKLSDEYPRFITIYNKELDFEVLE